MYKRQQQRQLQQQQQQQQLGQVNPVANVLFQNANQQQQAMLAAQLSAFAMAAAAQGNLGLPLFEQPPNLGGQIGDQGHHQNNKNDNRGNNNNNNSGNDRRGYNQSSSSSTSHGRRSANSRRDDQSPFPGYDSKRARF